MSEPPDIGMSRKCYECVHRGEVPGSAHSSCNHPAAVKLISANPMFGLIGLYGRRSGVQVLPGISAAVQELNLRAVPRGIQMGWFIWPVNFDPVWLINCDGFKAREVSAVAASEASTQP
jgi:hypothetical protein